MCPYACTSMLKVGWAMTANAPISESELRRDLIDFFTANVPGYVGSYQSGIVRLTVGQALRWKFPSYDRFTQRKQATAPADAVFVAIGGDKSKVDLELLGRFADEVGKGAFTVFAHLDYQRHNYRTDITVDGLSFVFQSEADRAFFSLMVV